MKPIPIIYYHSVGLKNPYWSKNFLTTELYYFHEQLLYFSKHFNIIDLKDYYAIRNGLKEYIENPLLITYDDGYLGIWQYAYPLHKKYGLKGTVFVSPEFVDSRVVLRPNLVDVWNGNATEKDLNQWGFLSWPEMRIMEDSGVMDIQSHAMTHTKYPVTDKLIDFHRPGADCLYYIGNLFPKRKPYYIGDPEFEKLLPFGYPVFEMQSSVVARKAEINPRFVDFCADVLKDYDFSSYRFEVAYKQVQDEYNKCKRNGSIILATESDDDYEKRIRDEIIESKRIIEDTLNKKVEFLCWPHGYNNEYLHRIALEAGYLMTTTGKATGTSKSDPTRIPERLGMDFSTWFKKQKALFKLKAFSGQSPYCELLDFFRSVRY